MTWNAILCGVVGGVLEYFALLLLGTQYDGVFEVFAVAVLLLIAARVAGLAVKSKETKKREQD